MLDVVDDPGSRKREDLQQPTELVPRGVVLVAPAFQPESPCDFHMVEYAIQQTVIEPDTVVLVMTTKLRAQKRILHLELFVAVESAPLPEGFHRSAQTLLRSLAFDDPVTLTRARPVVGKSEKVECAVPTAVLRLGRWSSESHQLRLLRMHGQPETLEAFLDGRHDPAGVILPRAANDKVVGETDQEGLALEVKLEMPDKPAIQDMVEEDVAEHRRDDTALRSPSVGVLQGTILKDTGVEPLADEAEQPSRHPPPEPRSCWSGGTPPGESPRRSGASGS